jgi:hypothetical protein
MTHTSGMSMDDDDDDDVDAPAVWDCNLPQLLTAL